MACLNTCCQTAIPDPADSDGGTSLSDCRPNVLLPPSSAVYRHDLRSLGYAEHWRIQRTWRVLGTWWQKFTRSEALSSGRVVHIQDHREIEVELGEVPSEAQGAIWPLLEEFLEYGFSDHRFTSYSDPFNKLEIVSVQAVQQEVSAVLRITRTRRLDGAASPQLAVEILTVYPDGSTLSTTNVSPKLRSPEGEKRQARDGAVPGELWSMHTQVVATIPYRPKAATDAAAGWELTNEVEATRERFNLTRGVYAKRSLVECANDQARMLPATSWSYDENPGQLARIGFRGALVAFAWVFAVVAFLVTICMATMGSKLVTSSQPAAPSPAPVATKPAEVKPQPRFAGSAAPRLRDAE